MHPYRLDEYLIKIQKKVNDKWKSLPLEIQEFNSLNFNKSLKCEMAQYKLKNNRKKDRNAIEDTVFYALNSLLSQKRMTDNQIASHIYSMTQSKQLKWSQNIWESKIKKMRLGHSWDGNKVSGDIVLTFCRMFQ